MTALQQTPSRDLAVPTVLVVDDEDLPRRAISRAITMDIECRVIEAPSGERALELLQREHVDVVLSDYNMTGMTGVDFLRHVSLRFPNVVRLMITSSHELDVAIKAINLGEVTRFLRKPWSDEDLVHAVSTALAEAANAAEIRKLKAEAARSKKAERTLEAEHPGITSIRRDETGAIHIDEDLDS
jgi:response regulator RpfG family c-di-GMP phosphodiesterase